jgi:hypothetical protein
MQGFRSRRATGTVLAAIVAAALAAVMAAATSPAGARMLDADPARAAPVSGPAPPTATLVPGEAVRSYRIEEWKLLANESLVIRTNDGQHYRATLSGRCIGLKYTDTIAFVTRGARSVDHYAGIMLPDGSRCYFKTFAAIPPPSGSLAPLTAPTGRRPPATPSR